MFKDNLELRVRYDEGEVNILSWFILVKVPPKMN
jgi:hypothetical protein